MAVVLALGADILVGHAVICDGADEVVLIIVTVCVRLPIVANSGGPATVNTFQAEDEVFVCHVSGEPVLLEGSAVQPELVRRSSKDSPVGGSRAEGVRVVWVPA